MRNSGVKYRKAGFIDPQLWVNEWRRLHPSKTAVCIASQLGAPLKTVEKWLGGQSAPSLLWIGRIFEAYGPSFVVAGMIHPPAWLRDASRAEKRTRLAAQRAAIDAEFDDLEYAELEA